MADFADMEDVFDWANEVVSWATENNMISGAEDKNVRPKYTASRAQILFNLSEQR